MPPRHAWGTGGVVGQDSEVRGPRPLALALAAAYRAVARTRMHACRCRTACRACLAWPGLEDGERRHRLSRLPKTHSLPRAAAFSPDPPLPCPSGRAGPTTPHHPIHYRLAQKAKLAHHWPCHEWIAQKQHVAVSIDPSIGGRYAGTVQQQTAAAARRNERTVSGASAGGPWWTTATRRRRPRPRGSPRRTTTTRRTAAPTRTAPPRS